MKSRFAVLRMDCKLPLVFVLAYVFKHSLNSKVEVYLAKRRFQSFLVYAYVMYDAAKYRPYCLREGLLTLEYSI